MYCSTIYLTTVLLIITITNFLSTEIRFTGLEFPNYHCCLLMKLFSLYSLLSSYLPPRMILRDKLCIHYVLSSNSAISCNGMIFQPCAPLSKLLFSLSVEQFLSLKISDSYVHSAQLRIDSKRSEKKNVVCLVT